MKKAYIIGAGGFAKEVYLLLKRAGGYEFCGFIDDKASASELKVGSSVFPIIQETEFFSRYSARSEVVLFVGIGAPNVIKKVSQKFGDFEFPNLVSPCVEIDESISFGKGNIITKGVNFTVDTQVGSFNIFNLNTTVGHDTRIGSFNVINPGVSVSGGVVLGECNLLGTGCSVLQYLTIGDRNVIGANGLLTKNIENEKTMVGVPCKEMPAKK